MCGNCWSKSCGWWCFSKSSINNIHKVLFDCAWCDFSCDNCNILTVKKLCNGILTLWCINSWVSDTTCTSCSDTEITCWPWTINDWGVCVPCGNLWQYWCGQYKDQCNEWIYNPLTGRCE